MVYIYVTQVYTIVTIGMQWNLEINPENYIKILTHMYVLV